MDEQTITLWKQSISADVSAEGSIRSPYLSSEAAEMPVLHQRVLRSGNSGRDVPCDFELGELLGSGGMGVVFRASQAVFNRSVAVKMVKPGRSDFSGGALLAEAVVTGNLEHPNVVPVYDLGVDDDGNLFYAMREIQGRLWSEGLAEKSLNENLDILLRVADTVSFAHSRGILHRDLKPHNIMLGEFGEILLMDWGASCALPGCSSAGVRALDASLCGTPAYMPPEIARHDTNRIGETSDIYLLGAILYQILTGQPPRKEKDPLLCLSLAAENHIDPIGEETELSRIALKAMASAPADRYRSVKEFQQALRDYRAHSESLILFEHAKANVLQALADKEYDLFNRALYGAREALELWPENTDAEKLCTEIEAAYARCALDNKDYELALSVLKTENPVHQDLLHEVKNAIQDRDSQRQRTRRLRMTARILGVTTLFVFMTSFFAVRSEQKKTAKEHQQSLIHLITAQYESKNYEAVTATFHELNDQYGTNRLTEKMLLELRVAAAMNPWIGAIDTGLDGAFGIVPSGEESCVWITGKRKALKVRLHPDAGWNPATLTSIHDYSFGKRNPPGSVIETVSFPSDLPQSQAFCEGVDGSLWMGSGSKLFRKEEGGWETVLDMSQLAIPLLPEEYNIDRAALEEWMKTTGKNQPITGILLNKAKTCAAVALEPNTVCWVDLADKKILGWLAVGNGTLFGRPLSDRSGQNVKLVLSMDEKQLLFRPEARNGSLVFIFRVPDLYREAYFYCRDYAVPAVARTDSGRLICGSQLGMIFSPDERLMPLFREFYLPEDHPDFNRWFPEPCTIQTVPCGEVVRAAFSKDGKRFVFLNRESVLYFGMTGNPEGFRSHWKTADRTYAGEHLTDDGLAVFLTENGVLHLYNLNDYSVCDLTVDGHIAGISRGWNADNLAALVKQAGKTRLCELRVNEDGTLLNTPLMETEAQTLACSPDGQFAALGNGPHSVVYRLSDQREVYRWKNLSGQSASRLQFSEDGRWFLLGGKTGEAWQLGLKIVKTGSWDEVMSRTYETAEFEGAAHHTDVALDSFNGRSTLLLTRGGPKTFEAYTVTPGESPQLRWTQRTEASPLAVIPFTDPSTGKRMYWCKLWFNDCSLFDAETGAVSGKKQNHWRQTGIGHPEYISQDSRVVFPMKSGQIQIALKSDLYPLFDPRLIDGKVERVLLNKDATRLYLLDAGKLRCVKLPDF